MDKAIAITMGDPAGVGPEIIARAYLEAPELLRGCFVVGDVAQLRRANRLVCGNQTALALAVIDAPHQALSLPARCLPLLQVGAPMEPVAFGRVSAVGGAAAGACVVWAAQAALRGDIAALVTAPLNKAALALAGQPYSNFPGHTELLQAQAAEYAGATLAAMPVRMMLANDELRVVLVSIHISLREAIEAVTCANVLQTLLITHQSLSAVLRRTPRIAVAGLNPHAGEGGLFGREELDIIAPAIAQARDQGLDVSGPFAPDTVFMRSRAKPGQSGEFDAVVAMYHDQGLIPVKYLGLEQGVNVTLGLPLVRTSPDHGTAFDIAGSGQADATSLLAAIRVARELSA
jgi:4-hydroxythreonine-4-phosphate dehydrogenase